MSALTLEVAGSNYTAAETTAICAGYAFAERPQLGWKPPRVLDDPMFDTPQVGTAGRWAYRTYDCVTAGPGPRLSDVDVFVADGLNGQMRAHTIGAVHAVASEVSDVLQELDRCGEEGSAFWTLPIEHIADIPPEETTAWWMWRAWSILIGTPGIGVAVTHKLLHHKRPTTFPLLDNRTISALPGNSWARIHCDLTDAGDAWAQVEDSFNELARARGGVVLTRLRIHDIVLWLRSSGQLDEARIAGERVLGTAAG